MTTNPMEAGNGFQLASEEIEKKERERVMSPNKVRNFPEPTYLWTCVGS